MKKHNYYKIMYAISLLLLAIFIIVLLFDYFNYNPLYTSFPFTANILIRTFEFILPSIMIFIIGIILKKKFLK